MNAHFTIQSRVYLLEIIFTRVNFCLEKVFCRTICRNRQNLACYAKSTNGFNVEKVLKKENPCGNS